MPKSIYLIMGILVGSMFTNLQAQKIKYKDIFPLLEAKKWDEGIPQLREYLSDPKFKDDPNGNLQIGLYYEDLVINLNLISDSTEIIKSADSSVVYLQKAKTLIDEKELKKNDAYYQSFYRRDLRTGEFGIKISDVHLDIEKKLQSLGTIVNNGREIYKNLYAAGAANDFSYAAYVSMTKRFSTINELYLTADKGLIDTLHLMSNGEVRLKESFEEVREAVSKIGKKGYSPELEFRSIEKYGEDGLTTVDFFQNDVEAWEYGEWAYKAQESITQKVGSLKEDILAFSEKLMNEAELLKGQQSISFDKITHVIDPKISDQLKSMDENPLPLKMFTILIKKNEYDFITKASLNPRMGDEDDVDYQLMMTDSLVNILKEIELDLALLQEAYIAKEKRKYSGFVESYGGEAGIIKFRQEYEAFLVSARSKWNEKNAFYTLKAKWGVSENGADSIYLLANVDSLYHLNNKSNYFSIATTKDAAGNTFVVGIDRKAGKGKGFMAMVSNTRKIVWKENFDMTKFTFDVTQSIVGKFIPAPAESMSAYLYSNKGNGKENLVIVNGKTAGQIGWVNLVIAKNEPVSVKFNDLVKETVLYMKTEQEMESMSDGEVAYFVIDRSGKIR